MKNLVKKLFIFVTFVNLASASSSSSFPRRREFNFTGGFNQSHERYFEFSGEDASIDGQALQLTPDTINEDAIQLHYDKSGRIMYNKPFKLWMSEKDDRVASFNTTFLINIYRLPTWEAGHGFAFLIAPNVSLPDASYRQWLGLTNAKSDGNPKNQIVAVEFDTEKQEFDPDDNHIGLNINSVVSNKTVSLSDYNITISPAVGTDYSVWIDYDGVTKVMDVYMAKSVGSKPRNPVLNAVINLKSYVNQNSYFGFSASTGNPQIQLNCVKEWSLVIDDIPTNKDMTMHIVVGVVVSVLVLVMILCAIVYVRRRKKKKKEDIEFSNLRLVPGMPREFKYKELKKGTKNFHDNMKLGEGGFGVVYKGVIVNHESGSTEIAVKKFSRDSIRGKDDFLAELKIIHHLRHRNLVRLVGWCYEKQKLLLVYDFMPNGSLERYLDATSDSITLKWDLRYKIVTGIASALHYLHNEYDQKVVHRDIKPSNILLDSDFNARLGDFGLARALDSEKNSYATLGACGVQGTMGYVAPECFHTGSATPESDVFGFGAVLLEVVCGRNVAAKILHDQRQYTLVDWVWMLHREGRIEDGVDEKLGSEFLVEEAKTLLLLGLACSHPIASERPQTQAVYQIITGALPVPRVPPFKPMFTWTSMDTPSISLSSITFSSQDNWPRPSTTLLPRT